MKRVAYVQSVLISVFIILTVTVLHSLFAKYKRISSQRTFDSTIVKNDLNVVMLYEKSKEIRKDKKIRKKVERQERTFKELSKKIRYKDAELAFVSVNVSKRDLDVLAKDLGVTTFPTFVLYNDGKSVKNAVGQVAQLTGFATRRQLQDFIEDNFSSEIDEIVAEKAEIRKRRREEARYYYPYYSPYYGSWWSPYSYYYPYYYGYPYFGVGFGFGYGGYGRRYYHRHHHGGHRGGRRRR